MKNSLGPLAILGLLLISACASQPSRRTPAAEAVEWPDSGWKIDEQWMGGLGNQSQECRDFQNLLQDVLKTDGLLVIKNGKVVYEWYDSFYKADTPHCLWSASKTVGATILATAVQNGRVSLEDRISKYYPATLRTLPAPQDPYGYFYDSIKISDMITMGAGFEWNEAYDDDIKKSSVLSMIYTKGYRDMATFAIQAPMLKTGPGGQWVYSGGNSNVLMGILHKIYGNEYSLMPWTNLFDAIGMQNVVFEKDGAGNFVASSYVHTTPRDMAKLGYLYLNDGVWNGRRLLPEGWVQMARTVAPPVLKDATPTQYIIDEGVFGGTMWLNQRVHGLDLPFPNSPEDMYFAAGHYGQLIIMLPSQNMLIARTAHDSEYWSKIDAITSKALRCFK